MLLLAGLLGFAVGVALAVALYEIDVVGSAADEVLGEIRKLNRRASLTAQQLRQARREVRQVADEIGEAKDAAFGGDTDST